MPGVVLAVAAKESPRFSTFKFDGIFGLSLYVEKYHTESIFSKIVSANPKLPHVFSLFLTFEASQKGSALAIGGYDSSKVFGGTKARWQVAHMYKYPLRSAYAFWAVKIMCVQVTHPTRMKTKSAKSVSASSSSSCVETTTKFAPSDPGLCNSHKPCPVCTYACTCTCTYAYCWYFHTSTLVLSPTLPLSHFALSLLPTIHCIYMLHVCRR